MPRKPNAVKDALEAARKEKLAKALPNCWWWLTTEHDEAEISIYTAEKHKTKFEPWGFYVYPNGDEAVQYQVTMGSKEQKELFKLLNITEKDEKKAARKKRATKEEKEQQERDVAEAKLAKAAKKLEEKQKGRKKDG